LILSFPRFTSESGDLSAIVALKNMEVLDIHLPMYDGNVLQLYSLPKLRSININTLTTTSVVEQQVTATSVEEQQQPVIFGNMNSNVPNIFGNMIGDDVSTRRTSRTSRRRSRNR